MNKQKYQCLFTKDEVEILKRCIEESHKTTEYVFNGIKSIDVLKKINNVIRNIENEEKLMRDITDIEGEE